jgi:radical SAM protein with 4Fe4S-binding SPASM domain
VKPKYCVWEITLACDLGCQHCGSRAGNARSDELSTEQCLDVVKQLKDSGFTEVTLIGGEAYLRPDWDQIAAAITKSGMSCTMATGGRHLDQERVQRAEDAGLSHISFSIDGLGETHDAQRGSPGSFKAALEGMERVQRSSMGLGMNTQINRLSAPELPALAQLLIDMGVKGWQVQLTVPMGRTADRPQLLLQPYELLEVYPLLSWIKTERLAPAGAKLFPGNNIGYFGPFEQVLRFGGQLGSHWTGCHAGRHCVGIEADGKIKGCPSLPSDRFTGGYTHSEQIIDVMRDAPEVNYMRLRTRDDLWGYCAECYYADVCKGGCTWMSYCTMGRAGNNPMCIHRAIEREAEGLRERLVRVEPPPGEAFDHGRFEIILEEWPNDGVENEGRFMGFELSRLIGHDWREGSLWSADERRAHLKRQPRVEGLVQIGG